MKATMRFPSFILKNVTRRPIRSALTAVSMAIGVGAVVSLVGISDRFEHSFIDMYERIGVDLIVVRKGQAHRGQSVLPQALGDEFCQVPHVKAVLPGLVDTVSFDEFGLPIVPVQGLVPGTLVFDHLKLVETDAGKGGRMLNKDDQGWLLLGSLLAETLRKKVGEELKVQETTFKVAGIFHSYTFSENNSIIVNLGDLQQIMNRQGQVTGYSIVTENPKNLDELNEVRAAVAKIGEEHNQNLQVMPAREHVQSLTEVRLAKAMAWLTSAVALVIGAVGMVNTMVMSVNERVGEIGILRAIGWQPKRVVGMVISEAVMLSIAGALLGSVGSLILVRLLTKVPAVQSIIDGQIPANIIGYGVMIAVVVGMLGGALPALRAARLQPTTAIRYE